MKPRVSRSQLRPYSKATLGLQKAYDPASIASTLVPQQQLFYINGEWMRPNSSNGEPLPVIDPSTAEKIAAIALGSKEDTERAVLSARKAFPGWSSTTLKDREEYARVFLNLYRKHRQEIGQLISMEMGAPIDFASQEQVGSGSYIVHHALKSFNSFSERSLVPSLEPSKARTTLIYEPVGVVGMVGYIIRHGSR